MSSQENNNVNSGKECYKVKGRVMSGEIRVKSGKIRVKSGGRGLSGEIRVKSGKI